LQWLRRRWSASHSVVFEKEVKHLLPLLQFLQRHLLRQCVTFYTCISPIDICVCYVHRYCCLQTFAAAPPSAMLTYTAVSTPCIDSCGSVVLCSHILLSADPCDYSSVCCALSLNTASSRLLASTLLSCSQKALPPHPCSNISVA
jgi:hypothetical protein